MRVEGSVRLPKQSNSGEEGKRALLRLVVEQISSLYGERETTKPRFATERFPRPCFCQIASSVSKCRC